MTDRFAHDDAAYALGALSAEEQAAFEQHLRTCPECAARVHEIEGIPALLTGIDVAELTAPDEPMPDTLLPMLLREASAQRRRGRWLVGSLATVAAACVIALVIAVWPTSSSGPTPGPTRSFVALIDNPVVASAALTPKAWGTEIDLNCMYAQGRSESRVDYFMYVYDRDGAKLAVGSWRQLSDRDVKYHTGTSLAPAQIAKIEIALPNGRPILRLTY